MGGAPWLLCLGLSLPLYSQNGNPLFLQQTQADIQENSLVDLRTSFENRGGKAQTLALDLQ
jgi:hypothetical protein